MKMHLNKLQNRSLNELNGLVKMLNIHGLHPIVIGGWAVWSYTKGAGSVDIDIVIPTKQAVETILAKYCREHGFKRDKRAKTRALFRKALKTMPGRTEEIELDVFTFSDKNKLASDKTIEIPWRLAEKHGNEWKLGKAATARVPGIEVLLMYKAAALIDRKYKLKTWASLSRTVRDRLKAKIGKDRGDILALLELPIDERKMNTLLEQTNFEECFRENLPQKSKNKE